MWLTTSPLRQTSRKLINESVTPAFHLCHFIIGDKNRKTQERQHENGEQEPADIFKAMCAADLPNEAT